MCLTGKYNSVCVWSLYVGHHGGPHQPLDCYDVRHLPEDSGNYSDSYNKIIRILCSNNLMLSGSLVWQNSLGRFIKEINLDLISCTKRRSRY